jgi:hypothetical protein
MAVEKFGGRDFYNRDLERHDSMAVHKCAQPVLVC